MALPRDLGNLGDVTGGGNANANFDSGTLFIDSVNNRVGIANTTPNATLTVTGTANVSGNVAVGGALTVAQSLTAINLSSQGSGFLGGTNQDNATSTLANVKLSSWFGIGFSPSITGQTVPSGENAAWVNVRSGDFFARGNITAYASDKRLKKDFKKVENALASVTSITGYEFGWDVEKCRELGFEPAKEREHGFIAQEIQKVMPDATPIAPFDDDGGKSKTGENYLTVKYEKMVVLLLEAIKELNAKVEELENKVK